MSPRFAAVLAVALALTAGACAQAVPADTTGKPAPNAPSYVFGSNVASYLAVADDVCAFKAALEEGDGPAATPDFAKAKELYEKGGRASRLTLKSLAVPSEKSGVKMTKLQAAAGAAVDAALAGKAPLDAPAARAEALAKGVEGGVAFAAVMAELDAGLDKIKAKRLGAKDGAPANVDRAVALYFGGNPECTLAALSRRRAAALGTLSTCASSKANDGVLAALTAARDAARKGDAAAYRTAAARAQSLAAVGLVQGVLEYGHKVEAARVEAAQETGKAEKAEKLAELEADKGEAYGFLKSVEPLLASADKAAAATLLRLLTPGTPAEAGTSAQVAAALAKTYKGLGLTPADVGTYGAASAVKC